MYIRAPTGGRGKAAQLSGLFFTSIVVFGQALSPQLRGQTCLNKRKRTRRRYQ